MGALAVASLLALGACAARPPVEAPKAAAPAQWGAPLPEEAAWPHEGRLSSLVRWWAAFGGPDLAALVHAAQEASPSISSAAARRAQAQAERAAAGSVLVPQADLAVSAQRRSASPPFPAGELAQGGLQLSWEWDVFGGLRAQRQSAQWRLQSADAAWHDARVSLAADVALQVLSWRHCEATRRLPSATPRRPAAVRKRCDVWPTRGCRRRSRRPAEAGAAQSRNRARVQTQRCDADVKALVQYTAWTEPQVRERLAAMVAVEAAGPEDGVDLLARPLRHVPALPAATLAQRPDVFMAAAAVAAAAADVGTQEAQRFPRVGLTGSIGRLDSQTAAGRVSLDTWSVGPLSISLPVFDAGRRAAQVEAARARYDDAVRQHAAVVRRAVREVEDALLGLDTSARQARDARLALDSARSVLNAVRQRQARGLASTLQADEALRSALSAEAAWLDLQRSRLAAWVSLYRAAGGGWSPDAQVSLNHSAP